MTLSIDELQRLVSLSDTKANITALSGTPTEILVAYATDTSEIGLYNGSWHWVGSTSSPLTTKGDLYGHSTVDARVPVGADGYLLKADSTASVGVSYVSPDASGHYEILMASGSADPLLTSDGLDYLYVWVPA